MVYCAKEIGTGTAFSMLADKKFFPRLRSAFGVFPFLKGLGGLFPSFLFSLSLLMWEARAKVVICVF